MGNSPGDDANNDGVNDKTGKNIFGGTNTKMTDEEREALDQEIMDLLDEEEQEKSMYSNDADASSSGGSYKDSIPDSERDETGWQPGDKVPSPGVYNHYNGTYTVDGKAVTKEEFDANQKAREDFLNVASDNTNKEFKSL